MLGIASTIRRALGDFSAKSTTIRATPPLGVWGDGIVDQSLSTLWYHCNWDNVSEDELAFLIPSLASTDWQDDGTHSTGPSMFLRRALCARVHRAVLALSSTATNQVNSSKEVLDGIAKTGVISTLDPYTAWIEGARISCNLYGDSPDSRPLRSKLNNNSGRCATDKHGLWTQELAILSCLDRLLRDSSLHIDPSCHGQHRIRSLNLAGKLVASIYASFNAAYVHRELESMHEMFTAGAWIGYLVRGRSALMPPVVAEFLIDELERNSPNDAADISRCRRILRYHADLAVGSRRLLKIARQVRTNGNARLTKPRRFTAPHSNSDLHMWTQDLRGILLDTRSPSRICETAHA
jgi:hypothetical protein